MMLVASMIPVVEKVVGAIHKEVLASGMRYMLCRLLFDLSVTSSLLFYFSYNHYVELIEPRGPRACIKYVARRY